jgi:predicted RNase H-like nuclease (RuvC/YqgF family)
MRCGRRLPSNGPAALFLSKAVATCVEKLKTEQDDLIKSESDEIGQKDSEITKKSKEIKRLQNENEKLEKKTSEIKTIKKQIKEKKDEIEKLKKTLNSLFPNFIGSFFGQNENEIAECRNKIDKAQEEHEDLESNFDDLLDSL